MDTVPQSPATRHPRLTILALFTALAAGCDTGHVTAQSDAGGPEPPKPQVGVVEITPQVLTVETELAGRTSPYFIAEVRPQVSGIILQRQFQEGSNVQDGQVLYQIDPATYQAAYDSARATLARDEATLLTARLKARRYEKLIETGVVSREDYDNAVAAEKQAEAVVAMDDAAVESARIDLGYTRVTAPIAGTIGRSTVTQGALVTADQTAALATIRQLDPIYVDVTQSSVELLRLRRALATGRLQRTNGQDADVELILEDGSRYGMTGRLQFSEVNVDERTGTVTLRAVFPNPDHELLPGMYVRAVLREGTRQDAILAPQQAVTRDDKGNATALVLGSDGKVETHYLTVERAVGNQWLVSAGLDAGDRLIVDGLQKVRPGQEAQPVFIKLASNDSSAPNSVGR